MSRSLRTPPNCLHSETPHRSLIYCDASPHSSSSPLSSSLPSLSPSPLTHYKQCSCMYLSSLPSLRCYLKLGDWRAELDGDTSPMTTATITSILQYYRLATEHNRTWYKAWHNWAFMNFQALLQHKQQQLKQQQQQPKGAEVLPPSFPPFLLFTISSSFSPHSPFLSLSPSFPSSLSSLSLLPFY